MRLGWVRGLVPVLAVAVVVLYLHSIKRLVHSHMEMLQRAHYNDSARVKGSLMRLEKLEGHINTLGESKPPTGDTVLPLACKDGRSK